MTNPINPMNRASANALNNNTAAGSKANDADALAKSGSKPASEDTVSLSTRSQQVIELQQHLDSSTGIDRARVDAIKQQIADGNYPLDAEKIAENMLKIEQSLIE
ncbi:MAG TPA: flagellar biosynthesis anti-sigma factor FlgM [Gammaproteobacteria bacterium]